MIKQEYYDTNLIRTYSDAGKRILQTETGAVYDEAIDVKPLRYTYVEIEG